MKEGGKKREKRKGMREEGERGKGGGRERGRERRKVNNWVYTTTFNVHIYIMAHKPHA